MAKKPDIIEFVVEGSSPFPIDMLRYDACYPATSADCEIITGYGYDGEKVRVTLKHRVLKNENPQACPERGRWSSFKWQVVGDPRWREV